MLFARSDAPKPPSKLPDPRPGLAEARVLGRDRQVADQVQDVTAADRVARDHGHDRLRQPPDLHVEVADVEAADALLGDLVVADVAVVATDPLVAAGAERLVAGAGEDDRADVGVVAGAVERVAELGEGLRAERVVDVRPVDRDLRDRRRPSRRGGRRTRRRPPTRSARRARPRAGRLCVGWARSAIMAVTAHEHVPRQLAGAAGGDLPRPAGHPIGRHRPDLRRARARGDCCRSPARRPWRPAGRDRCPGAQPGGGVRGPPARLDEARRRRLPDQHPPLRPRACRGARARPTRADRRIAARPDRHRGGHAAPRRARPGCHPLPASHERHLRAPAADRTHVRQLPVERGRLGLQPGRRPDRSLALLPAAVPRGGALDSDALRGLRHRRRDPRRVRPGARGPFARRGQRDAGLTRDHAAGALARGRGGPLRAARHRRRGRPAPDRRDRGGRRPWGHRGPDLRDDGNVLAGDHAVAERSSDEGRLGGAAAADHAPPHPGRRDPGPGADGGPRHRRRGRLAPHRRPRPDRRGRLPLRRGPAERPDRHGRRERPARGGGGGLDGTPGRRGRRRGRAARTSAGRRP